MDRLIGLLAVVLLVASFQFPASALAQSDLDCSGFSSQEAAQATLDQGADDPSGLDPDGDGFACESSGFDKDKADVIVLGASSRESDDLSFEDANAFEVAGYEVVEQVFQEVARPRIVARIVVKEASVERTGAAIAAALRDALAAEEGAEVGVVFAYGEGDDTDSFFTRGIAQGSRDGRGWTGDGQLTGPLATVEDEQGTIFVLVGSADDDENDQSAFAFPLVPESVRVRVDEVDPLDGDLIPDDPLDGEPVGEDGQTEEQPEPLTATEREYAETVGDQMTLLTQSMDTFVELTANPQIGDEEWTLRLAAVLYTWKFTYEQAQELSPPLAFQEIHNTYLEAMRLLETAADDIAVGFDRNDPTRLQQAIEDMALGIDNLEKVEQLLDRLREKRGL
jgi:hypothetical protein